MELSSIEVQVQLFDSRVAPILEYRTQAALKLGLPPYCAELQLERLRT